MVKKNLGAGRSVWWRNVLVAACAGVATLWTSSARATITQGDFSVFGFFESREEGRWGEGGNKDNGVPATYLTIAPGTVTQTSPGRAPGESGGSFDFNHWDLDEMRQLADIRPDYHMVKNYKLLGRFDTLILKDADFFAFYRPWYDAFGTIKRHGRAEPGRDWTDYTQQNLQEHYFRDALREYYAQLNFTDNFSMKIGKQEVIWSEADAFSGTEITNPDDLTYHWLNFESPENTRKNLRMIKFNYILPDFLKTANNELEAFVIPGDFEGDTSIAELNDARDPWIAEAPENTSTDYNRAGQPFRAQTFADQGQFPAIPVALAPGFTPLLQLDANPGGHSASNLYRNSLQNSEFGVKYATLLPVGSGLQMSFIYLYEARYNKTGLCSSCATPKGAIKAAAGEYLLLGHLDFGPPPAGDPAPAGTFRVLTSVNTSRRSFYGITGTYYDKDFTDMVFRYDGLYAPHVGINVAALDEVGNIRAVRTTGRTSSGAVLADNDSSSRWTEEVRGILAADRPTYIPWLSKQHTFLTAQYTATWYPDEPGGAIQSVANPAGRLRRWDDALLFSSVNWLVNGQMTSTNFILWDADNIDGYFGSSNVYRYSRNILFGLNCDWYLGRSGRFTDVGAGAFSRSQRESELEATFQYEI